LTVGDVIDKLVALTPDVVQRVQQALPPEFPSDVADPIFSGLLDAASRLGRVYD
jgi:serine/threonine-protein kinase HipA